MSLDNFRGEVRAWCERHVPTDWRASQTGASEAEFAAFQKAWFAELHGAGFAVPHWPAQWGGGMPVDEQIVLYSELAAHDAPRLVLAFVGIHHAASTLLVAGTDEQRRRHLPAILDGEIWVQGFSEPEAGSDLASLRTTARRVGDNYLVDGQKLWASGGLHADWCLLLARTDPDAPKRRGISYFLLDMTTPGVEVRPIRNAIGDSHFCEIFLDGVEIPAANLIGVENQGWQVAQATLGAERGMTMLELAERLGNAGFRWLVQACQPIEDGLVADRLARFEIEIAGLRGLCRDLVQQHDAGAVGPADASVVKLYYSELLQRMTDFGAEVAGMAAQTQLTKPASSGWESGSWMLDFIGSWEWTIPGGASEIQRTIIAERGLGLPREPSAV
ncbi:acyl-CoA dehydrogenase family protein [Mycolicibacterium sphagni]|uniref:Acyl-CoA dehydrogenase n=1 Tax=Mycolicibacterium sphagni TaxID=1786 RepID=A0A255DFX1_9MYCO|nr:acyl-CoA dehydrogenase family protein [Mycolicibacterium sphagni]MCV7179289.1 acyl-CoA dehydrogenase family protein [Mycolicibacterium sphagni]OYN77990.1 acyl-CoA dehydrogenase [Mycolicibacterium sphagni]